MLGLILGGWVLGAQIKAIRLADRYVTVKGLVERNVKSDLAIWPLTYKEAGDDHLRCTPKPRRTGRRPCSFSINRASRPQRSSWASSA